MDSVLAWGELSDALDIIVGPPDSWFYPPDED
jgi:hypothetical protein